jgi:anti-sigma regulatory factor (Ser/Thr protein kinase)
MSTKSTRQSSFTIPADEFAPSAARRRITEMLGDLDLLPDVLLMTSELVTNVIRHAPDSPIVRVSVANERDGTRVDVSQPATRFVRPEFMETEPHGRGLAIVEKLSDDWGVDSRPESLSVWFEVRAREPRDPV